MDGSMWLPEFDHEFGETRRALERVPEEKFDWSPHEKSFTLRQLAAHVAEIPDWMSVTLEMDEFDMDGPYEPKVPGSRSELLERFDASVADARKVLENASGESMMETWTMKQGGEVAMAMPRTAVLRSFIFNHNVHHRAQLGVYLRMLGVAVPGHYGPSADEKS